MASFIMPIESQTAAYDFQVDLDGVPFFLKFHFNSRMSFWVMDILDSIREPILTGVLMQVNIPITDQWVLENMPQGRFILIDESGAELDPTDESFGNDVKLLYEEEIVA
jgi:hypothetical protein